MKGSFVLIVWLAYAVAAFAKAGLKPLPLANR